MTDRAIPAAPGRTPLPQDQLPDSKINYGHAVHSGSAIFFRDQWVACSGVDSRVATTTSSTCSAVIVGVRPDRGSSTKPSNRDSTNRDRHLPTVGIETPSCAATSLFVKPVAQARTIRERNARACAEFLRRTHRSTCSVSSAVNSSNAFGRPVIPKFYPMTTQLRRRTLETYVPSFNAGLSSAASWNPGAATRLSLHGTTTTSWCRGCRR